MTTRKHRAPETDGLNFSEGRRLTELAHASKLTPGEKREIRELVARSNSLSKADRAALLEHARDGTHQAAQVSKLLDRTDVQTTDHATPAQPAHDAYTVDFAKTARTYTDLLTSRLIATLTPEQSAMLLTALHLLRCSSAIIDDDPHDFDYEINAGCYDRDMEAAQYLLTGHTFEHTKRADEARRPATRAQGGRDE